MRTVSSIKKSAAVFFILVCSTVPVFSYPFSAYDHSENPTFLSVEYGGWDREYLEAGFRIR